MENIGTIDLAVDVTEAEDGLQAIAKSLTGKKCLQWKGGEGIMKKKERG